MTTDTERARQSHQSLPPALVGGALLVSLGCVLVAAATSGSTGVWGSLVGAALVFAFFGASLVVLGATRTAEPAVALLVALALYTAKVVALALVFVLLQGAGLLGEPLHRGALALTIIVCTLAWTALQVAVAVRARVPLYDVGTRS